MSKKVNQSGERNFLIGLSKQTAGSDGFMPSGHHNHRKFWYTVIGVIVVIVLIIFGVNIYGSHQSSSKPVHHAKVTKMTKKPARHKKAKQSKRADKAKTLRERARRRAKRAKKLVRKREAEERRMARRDHTTVARRTVPQRRTARQYTYTNVRDTGRTNAKSNQTGGGTQSSRSNQQRQ